VSDSTDEKATPPTLDFERLTAPVADGAPTGADIRADQTPGSLYYRIKDARNAARSVERQLLLDPESVTSAPDWSAVTKLAPEILASKGKDLEVVAWYVEGLLRKEGFAGLRDGFRLARELVEKHWDGLYPTPDEEGVRTRVAPISGLNGEDAEGTLIAPIRSVPLTGGRASRILGPWEYEKAAELERLADADEKERRVAAGAITMQQFEAAVRESGAEFYRTLFADLEGARQEFEKLGTVLDEKCGEAAPPKSNVREALEKYGDTLKFVARAYLEQPAADGAAAGADGAAAGPGGGGGAGGGGPLRTREDAFRQLEAVSEFFRRTEPHSPLSYTLEQAVRWGRMPLPDLLAELIPDDGTRGAVFRLTGIRPPEAQQG
jgi:type VI secretion system protein ImpA